MKKTYFVSDVHLGLQVNDPKDREERFTAFLRSILPDAEALYLLGDIWDFWYEYRDVVPKGYVRVLSALMDLIDAGVRVYFFQGNHDIWTYHYFEELGMVKLKQPYILNINGKVFCLGHGDGLGPVPVSYRIMRALFHSPVCQFALSLLHPWLAYRWGTNWSRGSRLSRRCEYDFRGADEPLYKFAQNFGRDVDCFIFGHYHTGVDMILPCGSRLMVLKDWMEQSPYIYFDGSSVFGGYFQKSEK